MILSLMNRYISYDLIYSFWGNSAVIMMGTTYWCVCSYYYSPNCHTEILEDKTLLPGMPRLLGFIVMFYIYKL